MMKITLPRSSRKLPFHLPFERKFYFFLFVAVLLVILDSCGFKSPSYNGEWKVRENGKNWSMVLSEDGTAFLILENQVFGGENFEVSEKKFSLAYEFDSSKDPNWLDFIIKDKDGSEVKRLKTSARFLTDDKMEVRFNFRDPEQRHMNFDPEDSINTAVFERVFINQKSN